VAKSAGSGEPAFTSMDALLYRLTVALRRVIFKREKGSAQGVRDHLFRPKLLLHGLISLTISQHWPFNVHNTVFLFYFYFS
jgi:hypothetical protein